MGPWHTSPVFVFVWHEPPHPENTMMRLKPESVALNMLPTLPGGERESFAILRNTNNSLPYGTTVLNDSL
jgi:hypothetical protein